LIFSSLLFIFSSTSALAGWVPPDARPFVAATVQTSRVDDGGLAAFSNLYGGASITMLGVELGFPVTKAFTLHTRYQKVGSSSKPYYAGSFSHLKVSELTVGVSYGYELTCWLVPRIQLDIGASASDVTLGSTYGEYSDSALRPMAGGKIGIEFRSPGFSWSKSASHRWFRQISVSLLVSYGAQWRQSVHFNSASPGDAIPGTVIGADLGSLGLSGHGFDVRMDLRF